MTETEAEYRRKDREYFELIGRDVIYRNQVLPIIAFQWLRFGAGHLFTLGLPGGKEMGAQRDEFYVLPTREEIAEAIDPEPEERLPDSPRTLWLRRKDAREARVDAVLALLNGEIKKGEG